MPQKPRSASYDASSTYHITARGVGRRDIFEDDTDRRRFLLILERCLGDGEISLLAWCLMENHVHLLLRGDLTRISSFMQKLLASYAEYFNARHDHTGHVFQGRFGSKPVRSEAQLLATIRYIHQNPLRAGIADDCHYRWSSYDEQLSGSGLTKDSKLTELFGGKSGFVSFHNDLAKDSLADVSYKDVGTEGFQRRRLADDEARAIASAILGEVSLDQLIRLDKPKRNALLAKLRSAGLSIRQIERLTGIGRGIIARQKM